MYGNYPRAKSPSLCGSLQVSWADDVSRKRQEHALPGKLAVLPEPTVGCAAVTGTYRQDSVQQLAGRRWRVPAHAARNASVQPFTAAASLHFAILCRSYRGKHRVVEAQQPGLS